MDLWVLFQVRKRTCSHNVLRGSLRGSLRVCYSGLVLFLPLVVNLESAMEFLSASFQKLNICEKKKEVSGTLAISFLHAAAE